MGPETSGVENSDSSLSPGDADDSGGSPSAVHDCRLTREALAAAPAGKQKMLIRAELMRQAASAGETLDEV